MIKKIISMSVVVAILFSFGIMPQKVEAAYRVTGVYVNQESWTLGDVPPSPSLTQLHPEGAWPTYLYASTEYGNYTSVVPNKVGTYFLMAIFEATTNYNAHQTPVTTFSIFPPRGNDGDSAYEIWLDIYELTDGSSTTKGYDLNGNGIIDEEDFLLWLVGDKGDKGDTGNSGPPGFPGQPGQSAYEIWLYVYGLSNGSSTTKGYDLNGNGKIDQEDFLLWLVGEKGDPGDPGLPGDPGDPGTPGDPGDPGEPGQSAYEIWLYINGLTDGSNTVGEFDLNGNGTIDEEDFLLWLVGDKGDPGPSGPSGGKGSSGEKGDKGDKGDPGEDGGGGGYYLKDFGKGASIGNDELGVHSWYIAGYEDGEVRPNGNLTREEFAVMLCRLMVSSEKEKYETSEHSFSDVEKGSWSETAIATLVKAGLIYGYEDGEFRPHNSITRAEIAAICSRLGNGLLAETIVKEHYVDVSEDFWAYEEIIWVTERGWMRGVWDEEFVPEAYITRAETATTLNRILDRPGAISSPKFKYYPDLSSIHWAYLQLQEASVTHEYTIDNGIEIWK